jgi:PAS domain S-box-containing protein
MQTAKAETTSEPGFSPEQTAQALLNLRCTAVIAMTSCLSPMRMAAFEFVNPAFHSVTGFSASEVLGQNLGSFTKPSSDGGNSTSLTKQASDAAVHHETITLRRKEGGIAVLDFRIAAVRDREAEIANFVYAGRDLTT